MKKLVYLAGPYTSPIPTHNVAAAVKWARALERIGVAVFVPHISALWDMLDPHTYEEWLAYDFEIVRRCDALFRFPGESGGAEAEVKFALTLGKPVFCTVAELNKWVANESRRAS